MVTPLLKILQWLPILLKVKHKVFQIAVKALQDPAFGISPASPILSFAYSLPTSLASLLFLEHKKDTPML